MARPIGVFATAFHISNLGGADVNVSDVAFAV